jgi:acyl-coenzyme A synthetase/AMP-(fatty) acid ligase
MQSRENEWEQRWLVGGGLLPTLTYADLYHAIMHDNEERGGTSVTELLRDLTRGLYRGQRVEVREPLMAADSCSKSGGKGRAVAPESIRETVGAFVAAVTRNAHAEVVLSGSGTSGSPTQVAHTLQSLMRAVVVSPRHRDDVWGLAFNPSHIAGVQVYLQALANANTIVNLWGFDSGEIIRRCKIWGVTHISATPTFYRLLLPLSEPLPSIRSVSIGGESANERLMVQLREAFPAARLHNIYASTEAGTLLMSDSTDFLLSGPAAANLRIVNNRLWVHQSLLGAFAGTSEWYDTGDIVETSATDPRRFRIVGRARTRINVGGEKVHPYEVESVLMEHPAISTARVFGLPNSVTGELLAAEVVAREPRPSEAEIRAFLLHHLPTYKIPRILRFLEQLPLTRTGKVSRRA